MLGSWLTPAERLIPLKVARPRPRSVPWCRARSRLRACDRFAGSRIVARQNHQGGEGCGCRRRAQMRSHALTAFAAEQRISTGSWCCRYARAPCRELTQAPCEGARIVHDHSHKALCPRAFDAAPEAIRHRRTKLSEISRLLSLCRWVKRRDTVANSNVSMRRAHSLPSMARPERFAAMQALRSTHRFNDGSTWFRAPGTARGLVTGSAARPIAGRPRETRDAPRERPYERIRL